MTNLQKLRYLVTLLTYEEMMLFASWFANTEITLDGRSQDSFWAHVINDWANNAELPGDEAESKP